MQSQGAEGGVVGVGKAVDDGVEGVTADCFVFVLCRERDVVSILTLSMGQRRERRMLTGCLDKRRVVLLSQQRVGKVAEELLQQASYTVDVVEEVLGVAEVEIAGARIWNGSLALSSASNKALDRISYLCQRVS